MRTWAQRQASTQDGRGPGLSISVRPFSRNSRGTGSSSGSRHLAGKSGSEPLLDDTAHEPPDTRSESPPGHDFGRIAVHRDVGVGLRAQLSVNVPGDEYEQEADRVAERVMRMPDPRLQRTCACGGTCPECRKKKEEQGRLQARHVDAGTHGGMVAPPIVHEVLTSPGQPLDRSTRAFLEPRFGHDFSRVRVHAGAHAHEAARSVHALAFTVGQDVVFGAGRYAPGTSAGLRLLAHELTHTIQQADHSKRSGDAVVQRSELPDDQGAVSETAVAPEELESEDEDEEPGSEDECVAACLGGSEQLDDEAGAAAGVDLISPDPKRKKRKKGQNTRARCVDACWNTRKQRRAKKPALSWGFKKKRKARKKSKHKLIKCCTTYDLSGVRGEELPAGKQPDVADQETNRDLVPIPRGCAYTVRWNMYQFPDQMIITDNRTGAVYWDKGMQPGSDQCQIPGPADVHIRVVPNPLQKPSHYEFSISKMCGRVKVTKTCKLLGVRVKKKVWHVPYDPTKDYSGKCDDE